VKGRRQGEPRSLPESDESLIISALHNNKDQKEKKKKKKKNKKTKEKKHKHAKHKKKKKRNQKKQKKREKKKKKEKKRKGSQNQDLWDSWAERGRREEPRSSKTDPELVQVLSWGVEGETRSYNLVSTENAPEKIAKQQGGPGIRTKAWGSRGGYSHTSL